MNELIKRPHPALVHFPITLYPLSAVFLALFWLVGDRFFLRASWWAFMFAVLMIVPVAITGGLDMIRLKSLTMAASRILNIHLFLGIAITVLSLLLGLVFWRYPPTAGGGWLVGYTVASLGMSGLVMLQGYVAALMIYQQHIGVDGESR